MRTELVFHNTSGALFFWHAHIHIFKCCEPYDTVYIYIVKLYIYIHHMSYVHIFCRYAGINFPLYI